jgi:hypothetical protein
MNLGCRRCDHVGDSATEDEETLALGRSGWRRILVVPLPQWADGAAQAFAIFGFDGFKMGVTRRVQISNVSPRFLEEGRSAPLLTGGEGFGPIRRSSTLLCAAGSVADYQYINFDESSCAWRDRPHLSVTRRGVACIGKPVSTWAAS